jgi:hypothetical protein
MMPKMPIAKASVGLFGVVAVVVVFKEISSVSEAGS